MVVAKQWTWMVHVDEAWICFAQVVLLLQLGTSPGFPSLLLRVLSCFDCGLFCFLSFPSGSLFGLTKLFCWVQFFGTNFLFDVVSKTMLRQVDRDVAPRFIRPFAGSDLVC